MRSTKWFTYLLFSLLYSTYLFSQDTVSVYFSFGSSKIEQSQYDALHAIPVKYDLSDLDSVRFVGATDSVGKLSSNLKLSEKRAKNVAKYCTGLFPAGIRFTVVATGEKSKQTLSKSRNVDILLFFKTKATFPGIKVKRNHLDVEFYLEVLENVPDKWAGKHILSFLKCGAGKVTVCRFGFLPSILIK